MHLLITLYVAALFFILTPGVVITLPPKGKKQTVAFVHSIIFGILWYFTHRYVWRITSSYEGFKENADNLFSENVINGNTVIGNDIGIGGNNIVGPPITATCGVHQMVNIKGQCISFAPKSPSDKYNKYSFIDTQEVPPKPPLPPSVKK